MAYEKLNLANGVVLREEHLKHIEDGIEAAQIPCITGVGEPTIETEGVAGLLYLDTENGVLYSCTAIAPGGEYVWVAIGGNNDDGTVGIAVVTIRCEKFWDEQGGFDYYECSTRADFATTLERFNHTKNIAVIVSTNQSDFHYVTRIEISHDYDYMLLHSTAGVLRWNQEGTVEKIAEPELSNYATTEYVDSKVGDISTALDSIIEMQKAICGLIAFTIDGVTYYAVKSEGSSADWPNWLTSSYNTLGVYRGESDSKLYTPDGGKIYNSAGEHQTAWAAIEDEGVYTIRYEEDAE